MDDAVYQLSFCLYHETVSCMCISGSPNDATTDRAFSTSPHLVLVLVVGIANLVQVPERVRHGRHVATVVILQAVLLKQGLDSVRNARVPVLGHVGEEVVLDLEVEVRHPPVGEPVVLAVGGVVGGVLHPVGVLVRVDHVAVGVGNGKVCKNVC